MLKWLQEWYKTQYDTEWEPSIKITTLDNPGWRIKIELEETGFSGLKMDLKKVNRSENDWFQCWVENNTWNGACGPLNLEEIIGEFRVFVEKHSKK